MTEAITPLKSNIEGSGTGYMPQLDSLRAFAVIQVLISHWFLYHPKISLFPFGQTGVNLFFVLSGFLISGILLNGRKIAEEENGSKIHTAKNFYIRRTLRIFPIYYLTIFLLFIINFQTIREFFLWYLFYSSNILYFVTSSWGGSLSHLWTLAVEEQFYIIWPFVILFIPKKYLLKSIIGIILIGPLFRGIMFTLLDGNSRFFFINLLTPANIDCFGLGALLAYCRINGMTILDFNGLISKMFVLVNLVLIIIWVFYMNIVAIVLPSWINVGITAQIFLGLNIAVTSLFLISKASIGFKGILKIIFENKLVMFIGKISYGIYLYHALVSSLTKYLGIPKINSLYINFVFSFFFVLIISTISWYLVEKPINNLKKKFAY